MDRIGGKPLPREAAEIAAACLLLCLRLWSYPLAGLWRDWFSLLCVYWIFCVAASRTRAWLPVTALFMGGLLLLYGWRQLPLSAAVLGPSP